MEQLSLLAPEDFLTMRLYTNNDSGNLLWEYAFGINGLHVYYRIPHDEQNVTLEAIPNTNGKQRVRTLGGLRLKYRYQPPANTNVNQVDWRFGSPGWYCQDAGVVANSGVGTLGCEHRDANTVYAQAAPHTDGTWHIWWEPSTNNGTTSRWEADLSIDASYRAITTGITSNQQQPRSGEFEVVTRTLQPNTSQPMQGEDVRMLEQVLWQLGYGPNANRRGNLSNRKSTVQDVFDVGCSVGGCSVNNGVSTSMEWMAWRFKYANEITARNNVGADDVTLVSTNIDNNTLSTLKYHWSDYFTAYNSLSASQSVTAANQPDFTKWLGASAGWTLNGNNIYTPINVTKSDLLNAMIAKESGTATKLTSGIHWGSGGNNTTPYRLNQGAADSWASFGFSQIKSRYIYGQHFGGRTGTDTSRCTELNADNPYSPDGATVSIVKYSMGLKGSCGRSFLYALNGTYDAEYIQTNQARIVEILGDSPGTIPSTNVLLLDDGYDTVSKAIGAYNQGASIFLNSQSWPQLVKDYSGFIVTANTPSNIPPRIAAIEYARRVKQTAGFTLRDYIWQVTESRTPTTDWPATEFSYCFTFGETHWGQLWTDVRNVARELTINSNGATTGCN